MSILDAPPISRSTFNTNIVANAVRSLGSKPTNTSLAPTPVLNVATAITNVLSIGAAPSGVMDTSHFLYTGCNPGIAGPQSPKLGGVVGNNLTSGSGGSAGVRVEFEVDSRFIEFPIRCNGQAVKITMEASVVLNMASDRVTGTAQAGGASTITLAAGDAEISGGYNTQFVFITGGTGSGQVRQISAYNNTTKVATVSAAWGTNPDATSTYRINILNAPISIPSDNSLKFITFDMGTRGRYRVIYESTAYWLGVNVDASGSVVKAKPITGMRMFYLGDSYGEGAGGGTAPHNGIGSFLAARYGFEFWHLSAGGTGFLAGDAGLRFKYRDRVLPPANAWIINNWAATAGGTYTVTQSGVTTGAIAWNAASSTVQTAFDSAFGVGAFTVLQHPYYGHVAIGRTNPNSSAAMTVVTTGVTGAITCSQFLGDIAPNVPTDGNGNVVPFVIVVQGSLNDDGQTGLLAEAQTLYAGLCAQWPKAIVVATGRQMNNGPVGLQSQRDNETALETASASLTKIGGVIPFARTFDPSNGVGYLNGTTTIAIPGGVSGVNSEAYVWKDQTHYVVSGYAWLAEVFGSAKLDAIFMTGIA